MYYVYCIVYKLYQYVCILCVYINVYMICIQEYMYINRYLDITIYIYNIPTLETQLKVLMPQIQLSADLLSTKERTENQQQEDHVHGLQRTKKRCQKMDSEWLLFFGMIVVTPSENDILIEISVIHIRSCIHIYNISPSIYILTYPSTYS